MASCLSMMATFWHSLSLFSIY
uniref:Uncharacterized protein n=1 Tax=Anguilla anguilla TaxID=7936 RepID=A0A0E9V124_ANGAN